METIAYISIADPEVEEGHVRFIPHDCGIFTSRLRLLGFCCLGSILRLLFFVGVGDERSFARISSL